MPDHTYRQAGAGYHQTMPLTDSIPGCTTQLQQLAQAQAANCITKNEYRQYRDWYLGLSMLDNYTDNLIARYLWARLYLPLGLPLPVQTQTGVGRQGIERGEQT